MTLDDYQRAAARTVNPQLTDANRLLGTRRRSSPRKRARFWGSYASR